MTYFQHGTANNALYHGKLFPNGTESIHFSRNSYPSGLHGYPAPPLTPPRRNGGEISVTYSVLQQAVHEAFPDTQRASSAFRSEWKEGGTVPTDVDSSRGCVRNALTLSTRPIRIGGLEDKMQPMGTSSNEMNTIPGSTQSTGRKPNESLTGAPSEVMTVATTTTTMSTNVSDQLVATVTEAHVASLEEKLRIYRRRLFDAKTRAQREQEAARIELQAARTEVHEWQRLCEEKEQEVAKLEAMLPRRSHGLVGSSGEAYAKNGSQQPEDGCEHEEDATRVVTEGTPASLARELEELRQRTQTEHQAWAAERARFESMLEIERSDLRVARHRIAELEVEITARAANPANDDEVARLCRQYEEDAQYLRISLDIAEKQLASIRSQKDTELQEIRAAEQRSVQALQDTQGTLHRLQNDYVVLNQQYLECVAGKETLEEQNCVLTQELDRSNSQLKEAQEQLTNTMEQYQTSAQEEKNLRSMLTNRSEELALLRSSIHQREQERDLERSTARKLCEELETLGARLSHMDEERKRALAELAHKENELSMSQGRADELTRTLENVRQSYERHWEAQRCELEEQYQRDVANVATQYDVAMKENALLLDATRFGAQADAMRRLRHVNASVQCVLTHRDKFDKSTATVDHHLTQILQDPMSHPYAPNNTTDHTTPALEDDRETTLVRLRTRVQTLESELQQAVNNQGDDQRERVWLSEERERLAECLAERDNQVHDAIQTIRSLEMKIDLLERRCANPPPLTSTTGERGMPSTTVSSEMSELSQRLQDAEQQRSQQLQQLTDLATTLHDTMKAHESLATALAHERRENEHLRATLFDTEHTLSRVEQRVLEQEQLHWNHWDLHGKYIYAQAENQKLKDQLALVVGKAAPTHPNGTLSADESTFWNVSTLSSIRTGVGVYGGSRILPAHADVPSNNHVEATLDTSHQTSNSINSASTVSGRTREGNEVVKESDCHPVSLPSCYGSRRPHPTSSTPPTAEVANILRERAAHVRNELYKLKGSFES